MNGKKEGIIEFEMPGQRNQRATVALGAKSTAN